MREKGRPYHPVRRVLKGLASLNGHALSLLLRKGPRVAASYITYTHRLYSGYGLPWIWSGLPWRSDLEVPPILVEEMFPEIDFTHSPELTLAFPRDLSVLPHELAVLAQIVCHLRPACVVEFGTADGRTALNIALYLPPHGELVTLDLPPPRKAFLYSDQPPSLKIKQIFCDVGCWDSKPYRASADMVFCDACDLPEGIAAETRQAFHVLKPGGVIFRHDYGTAEGPTLFWNALAKELPVRHLRGTTLLCLRADSMEIYENLQRIAGSGRLEEVARMLAPRF